MSRFASSTQRTNAGNVWLGSNAPTMPADSLMARRGSSKVIWQGWYSLTQRANKRMPGKVQHRQGQQASTRLSGAKMMRPKDAGSGPKPHRQGGAVGRQNTYRAFKSGRRRERGVKRNHCQGARAGRAGPSRWRKQEHDLPRETTLCYHLGYQSYPRRRA